MKPESTPASGSGQVTPRIRSLANLIRHHRKPALLATAVVAGFASCAPATHHTPPAGRALINASPESGRRDRIDGIQIVSVNDIATRGTMTALNPGRNTVRVGFRWPQGGSQEVDLQFHAVAGSSYIIQYEAFPPYANRMNESTAFDRTAGDLAGLAQGSGEAGVLLLPPLTLLWGAALVKRGANEIEEHHKPAHYIDLMVICRQSSEGIVRRVRAFPDGRVDASPWAAHAQMRAPW